MSREASAPVRLVADLIRFMECGDVADGLFAPEVFADLTLPRWRIQSVGVERLVEVRAQSHPHPGQVRVERVEHTGSGFTLEFEEHWVDGGQRWFSREMIRADVSDRGITEMSIYCTGDWDEARQREHAEVVELVRA